MGSKELIRPQALGGVSLIQNGRLIKGGVASEASSREG